jgi:hypothetical protein
MTDGKAHDAVNRPGYYTRGKYHLTDVLLDWFPADPLLWQVGKYIMRAGHKGPALEDLQKAAWYLNRRIEREQAAAFCAGCPHEGWRKGSPRWCYRFGKSAEGASECGRKEQENERLPV